MKKQMIALALGTAVVGATPVIALAQQAAPAQESKPRRIETTVFDSWTVTCGENEAGKKNCNAVLRVIDNESGNVVLVWLVAKDANNKLASAMQTPTGIQLANGVSLKLGAAAARKLAYVNCMPNHCEAVAPLDAAFLKEINAATEASATITLVDGRTAEFKFPLKGATEAIKLING